MEKNKSCGFNNVHIGIITSYGARPCWGKQDTFRLCMPSIWTCQNSLELLNNLTSQSKQNNRINLILHLDEILFKN